MIRLILLRLLESYFRHRWLYLSPIAFMALAVVGYLLLVPAPYVAEGTLYVQTETLLSSLTSVRPNAFGRYATPAEETVGELYQLTNSDGFMRAIIQQTDLEPLMNEGPKAVEQTLDKMRDSIWFRSLGNNLVQINSEAELPEVAAQLATATIDTYTRWKTNISRDEGVAAQQFFQGLVTTYRAALDVERGRLTNYLVAHPEPVRGERPPVEAAEISQLEAAVDLAEERLRDAEDKEEETQLALAQTESNMRQSYFVVDAPTIPLEPTRSKTELVLVLALFLMVGGAFSVAGIIGGAILDRSFRFPVDVKHGLNLPVLAVIPEAVTVPMRGATAPRYAPETTDEYEQPNRRIFPMPVADSQRTATVANEMGVNGTGASGMGASGMGASGMGVNGHTVTNGNGNSSAEDPHIVAPYATGQAETPTQNGSHSSAPSGTISRWVNGGSSEGVSEGKLTNGQTKHQQTDPDSSDEQTGGGQVGNRLKQLFGQK